MMQYANKRMLMPAFIGVAVFGIALTLLTIVLRGPYTHSNLNLGYDPRYTHTQQMFVGAPVPFSGMSMAVTPASDPVQLGKQLFVVDECASCHGLDGRGGIVGPSIVGTKVGKLRAVTNVGPGGMPAFAPGALSDQDLAAIAAYLSAMDK